MTRAAPTTIEARAQQIAEFLAGSPGATRVQIAAALCIAVRPTFDAMHHGKAAGLFDGCRIDERTVGWFLPEQLPQAVARWEGIRASMIERSAERARQFMRRFRTRDRGRELPDCPIQLVCSAVEPLPFAVHAPRSVFELGGAA